MVDLPPGATAGTYPEPVTILHNTTVVPNISGATLKLNQVVKKGKFLGDLPAKGVFVLSVGSSSTNEYRFTVTSASGQFHSALGGTGTLDIQPREEDPPASFGCHRLTPEGGARG